VQLLLLNLGIKSRLMDRSRAPREELFPYRTKAGELRSYSSDGVLFELASSESRAGSSSGDRLLERQAAPARAGALRGLLRAEVERSGGRGHPAGPRAVYDLTEPQSHSMIANGFRRPPMRRAASLAERRVQPRLGERGQVRGRARGRWEVDWGELERVVRLAVRFLDDVIEVNPYPLEQVDEMVKANRRVGLGVMGWATCSSPSHPL